MTAEGRASDRAGGPESDRAGPESTRTGGPESVPGRPVPTGLRPVDVAILAYAALTGAVIALAGVPGAPWLLSARLALAAGLVALARIAPPARFRAGAGGAVVSLARSLYPLLVCPLFFWEAPRLTAAVWDGRAWWLESTLANVDAALFGAPSTPAAFDLPPAAGEALWALYFAYYPIVAAGLLLAWADPARRRGGLGAGSALSAGPGARVALPSSAFEPVMTATVLGFLGAYALFPFLPARAPIHAVEGALPASGGAFGAAVGWVQSWGGVTGSAFPSAHVSAAWAVALALARHRRRAGIVLAVVSAGMTAACVYTPYHWAADVVAGLTLGIAAGVAGPRWVERVRG